MQYANWIAQANAHWKEHQPKRYAALKKAGTLGQALTKAADDTSRAIDTLRGQGFSPNQSLEMTREQYLCPPEESGASREAPASAGFRLQQALNRRLGDLLMPGEREA